MADTDKLKKQLRDLTDLYENEKGRADLAQQTLSEFYRREPLVNLMWSEILLLRKLLETQYGKSPAVLDLPQQRASERNKPTALTFRDRLTTATLKLMNDEGKTIDQAVANSGQSPTKTLVDSHKQHQAPLGAGEDVLSQQLLQAQQRIAQLEGQVGQMQNDYASQIARLQANPNAVPQAISIHTPAVDGTLPPPPGDGSVPPPPTDGSTPPTDGSAPPASSSAPTSPDCSSSAIPSPPILPGFIGKAGAAGGAAAGAGAGSNTVPGTSIPLPPVLPGFTAKYSGQGSAAASSSGPAAAAAVAAPVDPGPQPTKPPVKPAKKMKALHWKPIITGDKNKQTDAVKKSLWAKIDANYSRAVNEVPIADFEEMFTSAPPKAKAGGGEAAAVRDANKPQRLLDPNRHNQLAIMLSKMPAIPDMKKALINLDSTILKPEQIESLHKNMFTTEDVDLIKGSELPKNMLLPPEQWILEMSTIPQLAARIECWRFSLAFDDEYVTVVRPLARLETTCQEICSSEALRQFLTYVLVIGNHLNGGTARGRADGFDIESLNKLIRIKDANGTGSLMDYLVVFMQQKFGTDIIEKLRSELSTLPEAKSTSLRAVAGDAKKLLGKINLTMKMQSLVLAQNIPGDMFEKVLAPFAADAGHKVKALDARATTALKAFSDCVQYLEPQMDAAALDKVQSEEWFPLIEEFVSAVVQSQTNQVKRKEAAEREAKQKANFAALQAKRGVKPGVEGDGGSPGPEQEFGANGMPKLRAVQRPPAGGPDSPDPANELAMGFPKLRKTGGPDAVGGGGGGDQGQQSPLAMGFPKLRKTGGPDAQQANNDQKEDQPGFVIPKLKPTTTKGAQVTPSGDEPQVQNVPASEFDQVKRPTAKSNVFLKAQNKAPVNQGTKQAQVQQQQRQKALPAPMEDEDPPPPPPPDF